MSRFQQVDDFLSYLNGLFSSRYRPFEGAMFTAVVGFNEPDWFLASGRAIFLDHAAEARPSTRYSAVHLVEEWVPGQEAACAKIVQLLSGHGTIAGEPIPSNGFQYTEETDFGWRRKTTGWTETIFKSEPAHRGNHSLHLTQEPVTGFGLPPFENGIDAYYEWMFGDRRRHGNSSSIIDRGAFVTVLPDTRARIIAAEWEKKQLMVHLEIQVPREQFELQCLFAESGTRRDHFARSPDDRLTIEVPEDTQAIVLYLLHESGAQLGQATITRMQRSFEEGPKALPVEEQAALDLANGENDEVEFKPFIEPDDSKMMEVLNTVVAFANTRGGRLYVGIDDHGRAEGRSKLSQAVGKKESDARTVLERALNKMITNKVKPVPRFVLTYIERHGEPVLSVTVQRGDQRPYATYNNQIYIRKGSTNVNPDPLTELRELFSAPDPNVGFLERLMT